MSKPSFVAACRTYFYGEDSPEARKAGTDKAAVSVVGAQLKALTPQDRADLALGLHSAGILTAEGMEKELAGKAEGCTPDPSYKFGG